MKHNFFYYLKSPKKTIKSLLTKCSSSYALRQIWSRSMDYPLNLRCPKTFNEKIQWLKLNYHNPLLTELVDKHKVKDWIARNYGEQYVIPTIGVYEHFDEIDFSKLPNQFVLKCNHDCGSVCVCTDKSNFDFAAAREKLELALKVDFSELLKEWAYKDVPRRIICEQYMHDDDSDNLTDYKFFCFNGEPKFVYVSSGLSNWGTAYINYMNLDWTPAPFHRPDFEEFPIIPKKPEKYEKMLALSKKIAQNFPLVCVDLYQINKQVYVSELTFYPGGGIDKFEPQEYDKKIGDMLTLPRKMK